MDLARMASAAPATACARSIFVYVPTICQTLSMVNAQHQGLRTQAIRAIKANSVKAARVV